MTTNTTHSVFCGALRALACGFWLVVLASCSPQPEQMDWPALQLGPYPQPAPNCTAAPPPYGPGCGKAPGKIDPAMTAYVPHGDEAPVAADETASADEPVEVPVETPPVDAPPDVAAPVVDTASAEIYDDLCVGCHGEIDEPSSIGPHLFTMSWDDAERAEAIAVIRDGEDGEKVDMPAFGDELEAGEIEALVDWIIAQK